MSTIDANHAVGACCADEFVRRWAIIRLFMKLKSLCSELVFDAYFARLLRNERILPIKGKRQNNADDLQHR
jgi:hypothetical protein